MLMPVEYYKEQWQKIEKEKAFQGIHYTYGRMRELCLQLIEELEKVSQVAEATA